MPMRLSDLYLRPHYTIFTSHDEADIRRILEANIEVPGLGKGDDPVEPRYFEGRLEGLDFCIQFSRRVRAKGPHAPILRGRIRGNSVDISSEPDLLSYLLLLFMGMLTLVAFASNWRDIVGLEPMPVLGLSVIFMYFAAFFLAFKAMGVRDMVRLRDILGGQVKEWQESTPVS